MIEDAFPRIAKNNNKVALVDSDGAYTYDSINARIALFAAGILEDRQDLQEERIAFLIPASLNYVTALLGIWRAGGIAVPLNISSAEAELEHYLGSIGVTRLIADAECQKINALLEFQCHGGVYTNLP